MTEDRAAHTKRRMGRTKKFDSRITLPLTSKIVGRIAAVLEPGEVRLDFIRKAIDRELKRREKPKPPITPAS